jgi:SAM-dependent methyltransferase
MNNKNMNWWNQRSDEYYHDIQIGLNQILANTERAFPIPVWHMIHNVFPDLHDKHVLVPSSGDNIAVFGFHLLGAEVTSCDISERQLHNAKNVADRYGWDITFVRQDSMTLDKIGDGEYDLVYTSNGVHVWIHDLPMMYKNFNRVLKPGGNYIMFETHPFIRPFDDSGTEIKVRKPYESTGPFVSDEETTYGWRIMDLFNAVFAAGFTMTHMEEFHPQKDDYDNWFYSHGSLAAEDQYKKHDWKHNPWAALPQWIGFSAKKMEGRK